MKTILIIDDDISISDLLEEVLLREGYGVLRAFSGTEAIHALKSCRPDLILLDLMLPGLSGEELLPQLSAFPVIVLSAKSSVDDKVNLLLGGAADYVTKPFNTKELLARISVALRKNATRQENVLIHGDLTLDLSKYTVSVDGSAVSLTKTEFAILKLLMRDPQRVVTKSAILDQISEDTPDCTESSLKTHISHLRSKLRSTGGREFVEAVWGIGYRLI